MKELTARVKRYIIRNFVLEGEQIDLSEVSGEARTEAEALAQRLGGQIVVIRDDDDNTHLLVVVGNDSVEIEKDC